MDKREVMVVWEDIVNKIKKCIYLIKYEIELEIWVGFWNKSN